MRIGEELVVEATRMAAWSSLAQAGRRSALAAAARSTEPRARYPASGRPVRLTRYATSGADRFRRARRRRLRIAAHRLPRCWYIRCGRARSVRWCALNGWSRGV